METLRSGNPHTLVTSWQSEPSISLTPVTTFPILSVTIRTYSSGRHGLTYPAAGQNCPQAAGRMRFPDGRPRRGCKPAQWPQGDIPQSPAPSRKSISDSLVLVIPLRDGKNLTVTFTRVPQEQVTIHSCRCLLSRPRLPHLARLSRSALSRPPRRPLSSLPDRSWQPERPPSPDTLR